MKCAQQKAEFFKNRVDAQQGTEGEKSYGSYENEGHG